MTLEVSRTLTSPGDTVFLLGIAENLGSEGIMASEICSPGIGFYLTGPDSTTRSLYAGVRFICPGRDNNWLAPGEVDSASYRWIPSSTGAYDMSSVLLSHSGALPRSAAVTIHVE